MPAFQILPIENDLKNTWKLIGTLVKRNNKGQYYPVKIIRNNKEFTNQSDIAEQFNQYFVHAGPNFAKSTQSSDEDPCRFINYTPLHSFFYIPYN